MRDALSVLLTLFKILAILLKKLAKELLEVGQALLDVYPVGYSLSHRVYYLTNRVDKEKIWERMEKEALRHHILSIRHNLPSKKVREKSEKIGKFFLNFPLFQRANLILFYLSLPDEVQTERLIKDTFRMGKRIAVPLIKKEKREIIPCELNNYDKELENGPGVFCNLRQDANTLILNK